MDFITLRGGLIVRTDALQLALALEAKGHTLTAKDGALMVSHGSTLTSEDRSHIQALKIHLIACVTYRAPDKDC